MIAAPLHIVNERLMLCPTGVLLWPARRLMAVADLHLEKASHFAARGRMLPPYDARETLRKLAFALRRYAPRHLVLLGDSFHDAEGHSRLGEEDRATLLGLLAGLEVTWVLGNHDPTPPRTCPARRWRSWRSAPCGSATSAAGRSCATRKARSAATTTPRPAWRRGRAGCRAPAS